MFKLQFIWSQQEAGSSFNQELLKRWVVILHCSCSDRYLANQIIFDSGCITYRPIGIWIISDLWSCLERARLFSVWVSFMFWFQSGLTVQEMFYFRISFILSRLYEAMTNLNGGREGHGPPKSLEN
jgi:hypothetical protein